jgi:hypothetical protein
MHQLERVAKDLSILIDSVGGLANWWSGMEKQFASIVARSDSLKMLSRGVHAPSIQRIQNRWIKINKDYIQYKREVCTISKSAANCFETTLQMKTLQAYYPPPWHGDC